MITIATVLKAAALYALVVLIHVLLGSRADVDLYMAWVGVVALSLARRVEALERGGEE